MSLQWIDIYVDGLIEYCYSIDVLEIYKTLDIKIKRIDRNSFLLRGNESVYIRDYFGVEVVFIRNDLPYLFEKFVLSHELGHALLHVQLSEASYNKHLVNRGKLERQADYFAFKLLNINLDEIDYEGFTVEQIAASEYVTPKTIKLKAELVGIFF